MKGWKYLILVLVLFAVMPFVFAVPSNLYTQNYSFVTIHCRNGVGIYNWSGNNDTLNHLMKFDDIWVNNEFPLNETWVDNLHTHGGKHRRLIFFQRFPYIHFVNGYDNPANHEGWKTSFLDDHLNDYFLVHGRYAPNYTVFAEGKWCDGCGWKDYFINYGNDDADRNLTYQYYDVMRADWNYDGIFFDLTGSFWIGEDRGQAVIKDVVNESKEWNVLERYYWATYTNARDNTSMTYDENGRAFLEKLREKNTNTTAFPIWTNQAYHSNFSGDQNEYYKVINADIMESEFVGWINNDGNKEGVSVMVDGVWYNNSNPVETEIKPFWNGRNNIQPMIKQAMYSKANYGNSVPGRIFNTMRPYYDPISGGYNATVDKEAIYYSFGTGKVIRIKAYARDDFDTVRNKTGVSGMPEYTGLPQLPYHKWAKDDIYFIDLGDYEPGSYEVYNLTGGTRQVIVRWFEKGFVILNTGPEPTLSCCINFSQYSTPYLKNQSHGVKWYYNTFTDTSQTSTNQRFCIPPVYRPLEDTYVNSARVYSYLDVTGELIEPECGPYVAYYTFEGDTKDVAGGNDGVRYGGNYVTGKYGEALDFDGVDDYVNVPDSSDLDITNEITISMWVKGSSNQNPSENIYTLGKINAYALQVYNPLSGLDLAFRIRNSSNTGWHILYTGLDILNNTWQHVTATYDGDKMRIYLNDDLVNTSASIGDTIYASTGNLRIGSYGSSYGKFNGTIDDVRILDCV